MRVLAYIPLHYGKEYLREAIKAIENHVEKIIILYTDKPSYGHGTTLVCPDTREDLINTAVTTSMKVEWMDIKAGTEGEHRNIIFQYGSSYDLILPVDADEVWDEESLVKCLHTAHERPEKRFGVIGHLNFYRSFQTVCRDSFYPIRIIKPGANNDDLFILQGKIYHFSYAQRDEVVRYKWSCHGHQNELRPGWLQDKFFGYKEGMTDLHPVAAGIWNPEKFDKNTMPEILKQHPNFNKEVIN